MGLVLAAYSVQQVLDGVVKVFGRAGHWTDIPWIADAVASEDSPVVANFKRAGAIIFGRTNTPAFSMRIFADNALHGRTLNPRDPAVSAGGSSGGAGGMKLRDSLTVMHQRHAELLSRSALSADDLQVTSVTLRRLERFWIRAADLVQPRQPVPLYSSALLSRVTPP
jgi:hypothetical protein